MQILLSIKPKYVQSIFNKTKLFEFRRVIPKQRSVDKVIIYSSNPKKRIVGYFIIEKIISESPEEIWDKCKLHAGIDKKEFFKYFQGKTTAHAIQIKKVTKFRKEIDPKDVDPQFRPPQSFSYVQPGQELYQIAEESAPPSGLDAYF
ncbi:MAG: hypothetical protein JW776_06710 [Candidatus Lokiarchaeota archaeon]|nr:hypothetical protein [Candidatus Lokiarchaeota archaeon]